MADNIHKKDLKKNTLMRTMLSCSEHLNFFLLIALDKLLIVTY